MFAGFDRGDFTKDIITPAFGVAWVGGVMAVYGAADAIVSISCETLTSLLDLYTKGCGSAHFIFTTLNI